MKGLWRSLPAYLLCGSHLLGAPPAEIVAPPVPPPPVAKPPGAAKSTTRSKNGSKAALAKIEKEKEEALQPFHDAFDKLDAATETRDMVSAMEVIRKGFPASRPVITHHAAKGSVKVRAFAVQVLGEYGSATEDLKAVTAALGDQNHKVRLAAIMACRRLGKDSCAALAAHLPGETDANNRKMTVKSLQGWSYKEAIPLLVQTLKAEKEKTVRNFIVRALEGLSGQQRGDDVAAWEAYLDADAVSKQAQEITKESQPTPTGAEKP